MELYGTAINRGKPNVALGTEFVFVWLIGIIWWERNWFYSLTILLIESSLY
jgi:hypothetical protein